MGGLLGGFRQKESNNFWNAVNRGGLGNEDQTWEAIRARNEALGLAPIRPTAAQEAASDAARLKRARDYWRNPGPKLGPFPAGDQVVQRERIPGGPISTLPADQAMERLKGPPQLQPGMGLTPSNDADYEALLTRARNGYYLNGRDRQELVGRFGSQLGSLLDSPAEGAAMRPREFKQRADRLKMMAALGIGTNGGAPGAPVAGAAPGGVPVMPVSTAGAPSAMPNAVPATPAAGSSGGAMPTAGMPSAAAPMGGPPMPSGVPLPGYQGMQQAAPLDTMLSGKSYLQNRAQINRAARDYRRSGFNPQMAALLAQEQQAGNRGFMAQSELMNRGMANEANAQAMGYNQGLGDLNIKDRTRQDMVNAAGREADFRDQEYKDRKAMVDKLMNGDGSTNPQAGMNDAMRYAAMDWMSPGLGKAMAEADGNRRGEPDAKSQLQAAAMAASQGDPVKFRQLMQAMDQTSGGAVVSPPPTGESGDPVITNDFLMSQIDKLSGQSPDAAMKAMREAGIPRSRIEQAFDEAGSGSLDKINHYLSSLGFPDLGPNERVTRMNRAEQTKKRLAQLLGENYDPARYETGATIPVTPGFYGPRINLGPLQSWWNSPQRSKARQSPAAGVAPEFAAPVY